MNQFALLQQNWSEFQWFASLGVGGVLAWFMFVAWRRDRKAWADRYEEDRKTSEERYERLASDYTKMLAEFRLMVVENTRAITSLTDAVSGGIVNCPYREDSPPSPRR